MPLMSTFLDYCRDISDGATNAELARVAHVHKATVGRWDSTPPTMDAVKHIAHAYSRPVLEVAVKAGLLTPTEAGLRSDPVSLPDVTNAALLRELHRRLDGQMSGPSESLGEGEEDPSPDDYDLAAGSVARPDHDPAN